MAEQSASDRTEEPTPERLRKARAEGRVPQSNEMPSAMAMGLVLIVLAIAGPKMYAWFAAEMRQGLSLGGGGAIDGATLVGTLEAKGGESMIRLLPFLLAGIAASVFGSLLVSGWAVSSKAVAPNLERISPVAGLKNLFSLRSLVHTLVAVAKLVVIMVVVMWSLRNKVSECLALMWTTPAGMAAAIAKLVFTVALRIGLAMIAIAGIDMVYQRWQYKRKLRMTRQEVKQERKQYEASPEVKGRIRRVQMALASKRMLQAVPNADVVVTNPTHVAVAIQYDPASMPAPQVVAKGANLLSEKIKEVARANDVPIVHRPQLARTLYSTIEVGRSIPETLFVAVAEILAMIYRLRKKRLGVGGGSAGA